MTARPDPDVVIAAWLQDEAPDGAPERLLTATRDRIRSTYQRRAWWSARMTRPMSRTAIAAALVVALVALGGAFFVQGRKPAVVLPIPTAEASASPSQPTVAVPSDSPAPTSSAEVSSPPAISQSLEMTWSKVSLEQRSPQVAWLDDQFVLVDQDSGAVFTSPDGFSWHALQPGDPDPGYLELIRDTRGGGFVSWADDIVGWSNPEEGPEIAGKPPITARDILRIVRPPAAPTETTPFKGRIESIGLGPAGMVAFVHSHLDWDAWVASKLGKNWVRHYTGVDYKNGILKIGMDNGPGLKVDWADEGFLPGDYQDKGFGWYSPDGVEWTPIPGVAAPSSDSGPGVPTGFGEIVGVSDGFIVRGDTPEDSCPLSGGCSSMWHSSDGLTWRNLGDPAADASSSDASRLLPWNGGALVTDGFGRFDVWTAEGNSQLPMAAEIRAASKQANPDFNTAFDTGSLGLVRVSLCRAIGGVTCPRDGSKNEVLVTRDGIDWSIQAIPAEMAADATLFYGTPSVSVGDRSVLVVVWSGTQEARIPSLWLGTLEP